MNATGRVSRASAAVEGCRRVEVLTPRVKVIGRPLAPMLAKRAKISCEKSSLRRRLIPCEEVPRGLKLRLPKPSLSR